MTRIAVRILKSLLPWLASQPRAGRRSWIRDVPAFQHATSDSTLSKTGNDLEAQRQDLDYFRKLIALDRSFEPAARQRRSGASGRWKRRQPVDHAHFRVALMEILALADNGHTRLDVGEALIRSNCRCG